MQFSLLWSLFEAEVLNADANADAIVRTVQRWNRAQTLTPQIFAIEADYFKRRYYADGQFTYHFAHLHLERSGHFQVVQNVLSGKDATPSSIAAATLIIVFRYRNNLFHGEKWAYELRDQNQNFAHANEVLMRAIELNRQIP